MQARFLIKLAPMFKSYLFLCVFFFSGCAMFFSGKAPPTGPNDTLVYFVIDFTDVPGEFHKAVFQNLDKSFLVGTAWSSDLSKEKKYIVAYTPVPNNQAIYLSEIHVTDYSILKGNSYITYMMTPQESPVRLEKTNASATIRFGGSVKMKVIEGGILSSNKFRLERCAQCPKEKEVLQLLSKIGEEATESDAVILQNNYLAKVRARLKTL
jgi:hypothetical protein